MKKILKSLSVGAIAAFTIVSMSGANIALAQANTTMQTNLNALNSSGVSGTTSVEMLENNQVRVRLNLTGTSPNLPHAQHFHIGGNNVCPGPGADANKDGLIDSKEGAPSYGPVKVSLTTEGAVDADSVLAVDRMPMADANGKVTYDRTFTLPAGVTQDDVRKAVVVHHGISELGDDKAKYDGERKSTLDPELPLEATILAACGALASAPVGGVGAGFAPSDTTNNMSGMASIVLGTASLAVAGAVIAKRRRIES